MLAPSNVSHKGHVKSSLQADLSEGEKVQGSLVLRSCVVDELQSAKEVYYCANNLEKRKRKEGGWEKRGTRERRLEEITESREKREETRRRRECRIRE